MALTNQHKQILAECSKSQRIAAKILFPHVFTREFDRAHEEILEVLDDESIQYVVIAAPRGIGKTSICNLLKPATSILFQKYGYVVPIGQSAHHAVQQGENLKNELLRKDTLIPKLFGNIKTNTFNQEQWVARIADQEICVMPRGAGQQIRGMLWRSMRPDLIQLVDHYY